MIAGLIIGILCMIVVYALSMGAYFFIRKRCTGAKYLVEFSIIAFAMAVSIAVKFAVLVADSPYSFGNGFANVLFAVYSGLGGLGFEGLGDLNEVGSTLLQCLYTGSSLYAGAMFVSVITAKASYEIYSGVMLRIAKTRLRRNGNYSSKTDLYIFTSATEDSLLLADSIRSKYDKSANDDKSSRKCLIIFTGDELDSFDRKNTLHREIMAKGYLYWSYFKSKSKKNQASILKRLGLYIDNNICKEKDGKRCPQPRIHIFALGNNEKLSGLESANSDIVFDEITAMTREMFASKNHKKSIVDFYVLTDNDINFEYYQNEVSARIKTALKSAKRDDKECFEEAKKFFQLHVINEAFIVGKCLGQERIALFKSEDADSKSKNADSKNAGSKSEDAAEQPSLFISDNIPAPDNTYRIIVLGFGKTGQQAMNTVFTDTAYVNADGKPSQFIADVYDAKIEKRAGLFAMTHPMFVCCDYGEDTSPFELSSKKVEPGYAKLKEVYSAAVKQNGGRIKDFEDVKDYMQFPIVAFHNASCYEMSLLEYLDKKTGIETSNKASYNAFIIALGNDEDNISMGNALIDDIKHENSYLHGKDSVFPQTIYINIRDEKNYTRINWTESEKKDFPNLKVVLFGNREKIYSYGNIIEDVEDMKYHFGYDRINESEKAKDKYNHLATSVFPARANDDFLSCIKEISENLGTITEPELRKKWLSLSMFHKESNNAANRFGNYFAKRLAGVSALKGEELLNLAHLEHNRWNRFHIANGWIYALYHVFDSKDAKDEEKSKRRNRKEHDCLCPFDMIADSHKKYDLINIVMAYKEEQNE